MGQNKFLVEPTDEALEQYKYEKDGLTYWHTRDFWQFDEDLEPHMAPILHTCMDMIFKDDGDEDDEVFLRRMMYKTAKRIIQTARKIGVSPQDFRDQFDNFSTVIWTPICIWYRNESGQLCHQLHSNLPDPKATSDNRQKQLSH